MFDTFGALKSKWRAVLIKYADRLVHGSDDYASSYQGWDSCPNSVVGFRAMLVSYQATLQQR
jgi:hypothetical protein